MPTISESDLVIPALELIAAHPQGIGTSRLSSFLRRQLKPTGDDLLILAGRGDDRFSQKVRNLKSHDTLERRGWARFVNGRYYITPAGQVLASEGRDILRSLRAQGFTERQKQNALDRNYQDILIEEGELTISNNLIARRSALLRRAALRHFTDRNGSIACAGCGFRAEVTYGPDTQGMIEIHHTKPLFLRTGMGLRTSLAVALRHVAPLCPNCHRVVHMDRARCMPISELTLLVAQHSLTLLGGQQRVVLPRDDVRV
jgi:predicted HNH restriction endonuclease